MATGQGLFVKGEGVAGTPDANEVLTVQGIGPGGGISTISRPYDVQLSGASGTPAGASITFAAVAGKRLLVDFITVSAVNPAASTEVGFVSFTGGLTLWYLGLKAAIGDNWTQTAPNLKLIFPVNTAITISITLSSGIARSTMIIAGGYLI